MIWNDVISVRIEDTDGVVGEDDEQWSSEEGMGCVRGRRASFARSSPDRVALVLIARSHSPVSVQRYPNLAGNSARSEFASSPIKLIRWSFESLVAIARVVAPTFHPPDRPLLLPPSYTSARRRLVVVVEPSVMRLLLLVVLTVVSVMLSAASPSSMGLLKMCPPGGQTFTTAWQLTCGMRKKRSLDRLETDLVETKRSDSYRPLKLTEMMQYCCVFGCSFRDLLPYCDPFGQWDS